MQKIDEIIVVEGRDDTAAVRRAVDAVTIETHGFGIREETWQMIDKAYRTKGIIVFTDPDTAGEQIRRRILARFPDAKEAFLDQERAAKAGDIGIENASPEAIREALEKVHARIRRGSEKAGGDPCGGDQPGAEEAGTCQSDQSGAGEAGTYQGDQSGAEEAGTYQGDQPGAEEAGTTEDCFTAQDLFRWGLDGVPGAAQRRRKVGTRLGIGQTTAKTFLHRLNRFGITREEIENALAE